MKKTFISFITVIFLFVNVSGMAIAKSYETLPQAVWSQKPNADYIPAQEDIFFVPNKDTLYLHMGEERFSQTKVWSPDTLRAVDPITGKVKWVFSFAKVGYGWPSTDDPFVYAPDGTVYAYFANEGLLYSVSPKGKENWSKQLALEVAPYNGKLYRLGDGTLIIAAEKSTKLGSETVQLISFDKNGKQKSNKVVSGKLNVVTKDQLVVEFPSKDKESRIVHVYNSSLKQVFRYTFPQGDYVNFYTTFVLNDGTIVFSVPSTKFNKLIALSPKGKAIWERSVDSFGFAFQAGSGYMIFNTQSKKLSYYNQKGLVKERIIPNFIIPEGDTLPSAYETVDGKLFVDLISKQFVLDKKTLSTIHEFKNIKGSILDYRKNSIMVYYPQKDTISKHILK
ncbi:hypothetical protein QVE09_30935 [Paenibacillus sp. ClWae2A]|uniref:hypothetical protein n=1 Tax=Paenibacillus sp. ClWae2A TaxID=3057177 RepID=UPI0028F4F31A|nr:hypothetical protein [Paenibacillus sp. ClWae2A]MDT9723311.1 hypothetical protein [Paenibacillus sp. ClWae2A]